MPAPRFRPKPTSHGKASLLRYIFPHTRQRARAHLSKLRHEGIPALRRHTQSRIYKYIVYRQAKKLAKAPSILQRLRGHTRRLLGSNSLENEARARRQKLIKDEDPDKSTKRAMSYQEREPGSRRKKLGGYLKAANELRQTYQQQYAPGWSSREAAYDYEENGPPSDFTEGGVIRSGEEEMILFPSYARKHIKRKASAYPCFCVSAVSDKS